MDSQLNGYVVFVEGVKHEVYAASSYAAQKAAVALYKGRKVRPIVSVHLVELAGAQVTTVVTN